MNEHKITSPIGLMINNYLKEMNGLVIPVRASTFSAWTHPQMSGDYGYYGIPITDQWLLDLGFKDRGGDLNASTFLGPENFIIFNSKGSEHTPAGYYTGVWGFHLLGLKYVHQIQNLFYCLTGRELMIKDLI
jgi:hypothetical protein